MALSTPVLYLNTGTLQTGDSSPFITSLTDSSPVASWTRVSGATGPLQVVLCTVAGGIVSRATLATGNTLHFTAKKDPSDSEFAVSIDFERNGSTEATEYYQATSANFAVVDTLWAGKTPLALAGNFEERNSGGDVLGIWNATLNLIRGNGEGSAASPVVFVSYSVQSPTSPQKAQARANIGAGTGSGDLLNSGTITLVNAGKVAVITAANTLGAGVDYASAATASTLALRDASGGIAAVNADFSGDLTVTGDINFTSTTTANFGGAITAAGAVSGTAISGTSGAFGTLTVSGISEFNAPVTINEDLDVAGELRLNDHALNIANPVTFSGAFPFTGTVTASTSVAFPTSGTLSTLAGTETLTNKRIPPRVTTITSSATPTVNTDNCDMVTITALAAAITSMTTNLTGTPNNGEMLLYRIKDDGTARAITWGASFEAMGAALPTTTVLSKVLHVLFIWNSVTSKWGCLSTAQE